MVKDYWIMMPMAGEGFQMFSMIFWSVTDWVIIAVMIDHGSLEFLSPPYPAQCSLSQGPFRFLRLLRAFRLNAARLDTYRCFETVQDSEYSANAAGPRRVLRIVRIALFMSHTVPRC